MNFYNTIWQPVNRLLLPADKTKGIRVVILMIISALLDFFSLASFLPLVFLLINPDVVFTNQYLNKVYVMFGFSSSISFTLWFMAGLIVFITLKNGLSSWITRIKANYCFNLGSEFSSRMLARFMEINFLRFSQSDFSKELNRVANMPIAFANNIVMALANLLSELVVFLILLLCIAAYDIKIFLLLLGVVAIIRIVYSLSRKAASNTSNELKHQYPLTLKYALQAIEGLVDIKAFAKEFFFKKRFDESSRTLAKTFSRDHVNQTGPTRLTEIIAACIVCAIISYAVLTKQNNQQTFLLLGIYTGASFRMIPSINRILNALTQIKSHEYLFNELEELTTGERTETPRSTASLKFEKMIELKNVSFEYPEGISVLEDTSLTIEKGQKTALIGKSGSGKTTILLLLLGFLKLKSGKIFLDSSEVQGDNSMGWRKLFGYVPQNPYILDASITENIAFDERTEEIDATRIEQLIKDLDLAEMIGQFPDGLNTQIGEKGIKLSGGQRQRIAIARALYADAEILLFDEITNQLDPRTEQEIIQTLIKAAHRNKTILMITHHQHLLNVFDRILSLENGKITEMTLARTS